MFIRLSRPLDREYLNQTFLLHVTVYYIIAAIIAPALASASLIGILNGTGPTNITAIFQNLKLSDSGAFFVCYVITVCISASGMFYLCLVDVFMFSFHFDK